MPSVTLKTFQDSDGEWTVFREDRDLSDIDPAAISLWTFTNRNRTALLSVQAGDLIMQLGLTADNGGRYNQEAYAIASAIAYMATYCTEYRIERDGVAISNEVMPADRSAAVEKVNQLSDVILAVYYRRSIGGADLSQAKKRIPDAPPAAMTQKPSGTVEETA